MFSIINKYNFATNFEHSTPAAAEPPPIGPFLCTMQSNRASPAFSERILIPITLLFNHSYLNTTFLHWVNVWLETKHRNPFYSAHSLSTSSSCPLLYPRIFWATYNNGRSFLQTLTMISTAAEERSAVTKNVCTFCWASLCLLSCLVGWWVHLFICSRRRRTTTTES